ncbi:MAG TPA: purine-nucleoside phosphorylase [Chitinophagaceae bacterium]|nr:purine-nucleoside phosphorylase [Chitinophagaceae bacterium]
MATTTMQQLADTVGYIKNIYSAAPIAGIVLGSGLGNLVNEITVEQEISYSDIPHFPVSTVQGHGGKLILGELCDKKVAVMSGRFHFYEGYTAKQIAYPVRVLKMLGIKTLLVSNAAGGVHPGFKVGDLMIIRDHISLFVQNPLIGPNEEDIGTRFPDMSEPYDKEIIARAKEIGTQYGFDLKEGVYTGLTGPSFETRAEYKLIKILGGDAVGMSTIQEVITAVHAGLKVFGVSVITNMGIREEENAMTHEEVLALAKDAEPKLSLLFKEIVRVL